MCKICSEYLWQWDVGLSATRVHLVGSPLLTTGSKEGHLLHMYGFSTKRYFTKNQNYASFLHNPSFHFSFLKFTCCTYLTLSCFKRNFGMVHKLRPWPAYLAQKIWQILFCSSWGRSYWCTQNDSAHCLSLSFLSLSLSPSKLFELTKSAKSFRSRAFSNLHKPWLKLASQNLTLYFEHVPYRR